jgi:hypothetical protein
VSKGSRNRQQAREKITKMRALEARRRRRRSWVAGISAAVVVIAAAVGITLAVAGNSDGANLETGGTPQLKLSSLASLGTLRPAGSPGRAGPEGVPIPRAVPLASTATAATGTDIDGIGCQSSEQTVFHIHAHLTISMNGSPRQGPRRDRGPWRPGPEHRAGPVRLQRHLLLTAHPCRRRRHSHRILDPAYLHPGRLLRRVGPAPQAAIKWAGHRPCCRDLQRPALHGQPPRHPPHPARPDPA